MSEIEKIQRYIERSDINPVSRERYQMHLRNVKALLQQVNNVEAILLAFNFGMARGYRAAKAEKANGQTN